MPGLTRTCSWVATAAIAGVFCARALGQPVVVASCDFEGPYTQGDQQIHDGCTNNWQWGRKDMVLAAATNAGRPGTVQRIHVRGIASGGVQFFYTKLTLKKDHYYRISYWLKSDGLEGPVRCYVRKGGYPWTVYVAGGFESVSADWRQYSFSGKCAEDVTEDVGVCWETGSLGTIWLDDLQVEESTEPFPTSVTEPVAVQASGNLFPRSSFEGRRDHVWSTMYFGQARDGVWEGVEGDWQDPYHCRAPGGKIGAYCVAVPNTRYRGQPATLSIPLYVRPGQPYTLSMWMKSDPPGYGGSTAMMYYGTSRHMQPVEGGAIYPKLTGEWQRISVTATPQPPPEAADPKAPIQLYVQIAPNLAEKGTIYVDGITLEPGATDGAYRPAHPLEVYADIGQRHGNLLHWGDKLPLNLLVAAADTTSLKQAQVEVTVVGYPNDGLYKRVLTLPIGEEHTVTLGIQRRGLMRVELRTVDRSLAAPQEMVLAVVPKPRGTGVKGMFGSHIAIRPSLVEYIRKLGFTWTRLHDCSLLTKWSATEREPGKLLWHDEVVDGVRRGGINLLGLPDHEPEWAKVKTEGANPVDVAAFERYCEALARHYAGKIDYWETWNEPYMPGSYGGGAALFGELLAAGYRGFKAGNPNCTVVGWCADVSNPKWGESISPEHRQALDVFSFHNYVNNLSGGGTLPFAMELPEHRKLWPSHVTECWDTEGTNGALCGNGFYTHLPLATRELNARATAFASRVWLEHARAGVSKFFAYQMHNVDTMSYYGGYQSLLIQYDRTPTPAAVSAAVTAYAMDALRFVPTKSLEGVVQALFSGPGRATWAVYDDGGVAGRRHLRLKRLPADAEVLDTMGNDPRRDGRTDREIGIEPLFVLSNRLPAERLAEVCRAAIAN
ncbi:MAG: hypothetical protein HPY69_16625 [Armatimonadetes bacterium]|nr:hypothetical protein [Armatimonadota bacterium]